MAVVAVVALVAVEALPDSEAVIVPALKLPEASRATMVEAVLALVAFEVTVNVCAEEPLKVAEPDRPVPDTAKVRLLETCVAVPLKVAVIVPALKLPALSRATIVEAVFALVAFEVTVKVLLPA